MADLQEWQTHPVEGTPEAATSLSATTGQPEWMQHPIVPPPPAPEKPVEAGLGTGFIPKFLAKQGSDLTFGLADKAEAALEAGIAKLASGGETSFPDAYHKRLGEIRGDQEQFGQTNPVASNVAAGTGIAGSLGSLPAGGVSGAAALIPKLVEGAKVGGAAGGLAGFGGSNDESVKGDLAATGVGAGLGAGLGVGGGIVADKVAAPLYNWVKRMWGGTGAAQQQAIDAIAKRMGQDTKAGGPTALDMLDVLNTAPDKPQALVDVAGENTRQYAGSIARQPGEGRAVARQALNDRDVGAGDRLAGDVDTGISAGGSAHTTADALSHARAAASTPAYEAAGIPSDPKLYSQAPIVANPQVTRLLQKSKDVQSAIAQAKALPNYADLPDNSMVLLDKAYKNVGGSANEAKVSGNGEKYRDLNNLRLQLRDAITGGDPNHPYQQALDAYSGPSASIGAVKDGQQIFNKKPEEVAADMAGLSSGDREFYRLGAADALKEKLSKTGAGGDEAKRIVGNQYTQKQLKPLFDNPDDYDRFIKNATAENRMFETKQKLVGGSQSAERLAEDGGGNSEAAGHALKGGAFMMAGEPIAGGLSMMKAAGAMMRGESPAVNTQAAKILFSPQSMTNPQTFTNLKDILRAQQARTRLRPGSVPASGVLGSNPVPILSTLPALNQSLGFGHNE